MFTTILVGAGLSICGLQMQTLFRNPLAGPFVLGISSGASLGVALLVLAGGIFTWTASHWSQAISASAGAMLVLLLTLVIALRIRDVMSLLIIGLMLGSLTSAVVAILQFFSTGEEIQVYLLWTFGSLGGLDWTQISILSLFAVAGIIISLSSVKALNAFLLGERYAESVGTNILNLRIRILLSTGLLAGVITAFCGPIAFIGLAVPHFCRLFFRTSDHRILLPGCLIMGVITMLLCDLIARLPGSQYVLPINAVSSLIGAPVVIWLVIKRGKISKSFT
jgi:iron complex transport system permease protein